MRTASNSSSTMDIVPRSEYMDEGWSRILSLRQELQKIGSSGDASQVDSTIDPGRTVDGPTLALLKSPYYPFTLCEEAPASYFPPPVPFDVNEEISRLRELLRAVQSELDAHRAYLNGMSATGPEDNPLTSNTVVSFLNDCIAYMDLAWGISSLQWFHRWVLSHSISGLWTATEQLEYVLTDNGQSLPDSAEVIEKSIRKCPFPMAVDRVEKDRKAVIQLERSRLNSKSRTYRDRVSPSVITAVTSPFLNAEEKYLYQELYNETEYCMQTHHLAKMKSRASRGSSVANSFSMNAGSTSLVRGSNSFFDPEVHFTIDDALLTLKREEEMIKKLIHTIRERRTQNVRFDKSELEKEASRTAQITVYGCLLSDERLMSTQLDAVRSFLVDYQCWIGGLNFLSHDDLMTKLSEFSGEHGKWPAPEPTSYYTVYQERFHTQKDHQPGWQGGEDGFNSTLHSAPLHPVNEEQAARNTIGASSVSRSRTSQKICEKSCGENFYFTETGNPPVNGVLKPSEGSCSGESERSKDSIKSPLSSSMLNVEFSQSVFALLEQFSKNGREENSNLASDSLNRLWMIRAVRLATQNFFYMVWDPSNFLREMGTYEITFRQLINSSSSLRLFNASSAISALLKVIQCLCQVLLQKPYATSMYEVAYIRIPPLNAGDSSRFSDSGSSLSSFEISQWGALLDALWFQVDPSGQANGGFLDVAQHQSLPSIRFLKLSAAIFSDSMLHLFYEVGKSQGGATVYTVREVAEKSLTFLRSVQDRCRFALQLFSAFQKIENAGILSFYACRVNEVSLVQLINVVFVYCHNEGSRDCWDSFGLLPPAAVELKRMEVARTSLPLSSPHSYDSPVNFSSVVLQMGDVLTFLASFPKPVMSLVYYYGETLREQGFWEIENNVVPHAFIASSSHPLNMSDEYINQPPSIRSGSLSKTDSPPAALAASSHRHLTSAIMRQINEIMKNEGTSRDIG